MAVRSEEFFRPFRTKKERVTAQKTDRLGVCLVGKSDSPTKVVPVCSGCLVKGLSTFCDKELFIVTSGHIGLSELVNCIVYFQKWDDDSKFKGYKLLNIWETQEKVEVRKGLTIIPIDKKKLGRKSGMKIYRPFLVHRSPDRSVTNPLPSLICQIVEGKTNDFDVKKFDLKHEDGRYALTLRGKEQSHVFYTFTDLTGRGTNSLHPRGAVILTSESPFKAVAVLMFGEDGKIQPVLLSHLLESGNCPSLSLESTSIHEGEENEDSETDILPADEGTSGADASQKEMEAGTSTVYSDNRGDKIPIKAQSGTCGTVTDGKSSPVVTGISGHKDTNATKNLAIPVGKRSPKHNASGHNGDGGQGGGADLTAAKKAIKIPPRAGYGYHDVSLLPDKDTRNLSEGTVHGLLKVANTSLQLIPALFTLVDHFYHTLYVDPSI